jgi:hypothetical protein
MYASSATILDTYCYFGWFGGRNKCTIQSMYANLNEMDFSHLKLIQKSSPNIFCPLFELSGVI